MSKGEITASKITLQKLFSEDFWFLIPEYQRSYVWQSDNINELIDDLYYAYENKPDNEYFLGSLVLKEMPNSSFPEYEVLDGQQRLTTFFIMLAVLRDVVSSDGAKQTIHKKIYQEENFLENIPARMRITYKIRDRVHGFIERYIISSDGTNKIDELTSLIESDNISISNMANAILVLKRTISNTIDESHLQNFIRFIFNNALFIYVSTHNSEDAFRMFTILNDRGVPLTNADILKSQNIGALNSEKEVDKYATLWEEIEGKYGDSFDRFLQFIRTILVQEKARANLLDEFTQKVYDIKNPKLSRGKDTFELINEYSNIYDNIIELQDTKLSNNYKNLITIMKIGFRSEDWIPPLLHYFKKFNYTKLDQFLKKLEYKFAGDWICGITPTLRLDAMNYILKCIDNTTIDSIDNLLNNDDLFNVDIVELINIINTDIYKKQFSKYILLKQEFLLSENTVHLSSYNYITVEHILPQNPADNSQWTHDFSEDERKFWTNKLANLVLISQKKNSSLGNSDFQKKKELYLNKRIDAFNANKVFIQRNSTWTPKILSSRQTELINLIKNNIW